MANETINNNVSTKNCAYTDMAIHWDLIDDLLGGTIAMRAAGEKWLPKEPKEEETAWQNRLSRSILYGAYANTVDDLVGRPFSKPVTNQGELPEALEEIKNNCDGLGTGLTQFAKELFNKVLNRGLTHVLVDYPVTKREDGKALNMAEEKSMGARPVFIHITPDQLFDWKFETDANGKQRLSQIRWTETVSESDGDYGTTEKTRIRVYNTDSWEIHEKNDAGAYEKVEEGTHTYPDGIPLATFYVNKTGQMTALPPLEDLAWENCSHYQSSSDQKNLLRFARFPLLVAKGLSQEEMDEGIVIGPARMIKCTNPDADVKYVEHTGKAIEAGRQDIKDIEERMTVLGLEPLLSRPGNQTATGQSIDEAKSQSSIQAWIKSLEKVLTDLFRMAAKWISLEVSDDFKVDIYNDFGISVRASQDIDALIKMRQSGELDRETFLREVKRRGLLSENADIEDVINKLETEGPSLGLVGDNE